MINKPHLFPEITTEMVEESRVLTMTDAFVITWCDHCQTENWGARLGCKCGNPVEWLVKTSDGRRLKPGRDVCLLTQ